MCSHFFLKGHEFAFYFLEVDQILSFFPLFPSTVMSKCSLKSTNQPTTTMVPRNDLFITSKVKYKLNLTDNYYDPLFGTKLNN